MIVSFRDKQTREFAAGKRGKTFVGFERQAEMKLDQLEAAISLIDLDLPGNRLKALKGARQGQYSIRINDHTGGCAASEPNGSLWSVKVEIVDYP